MLFFGDAEDFFLLAAVSFSAGKSPGFGERQAETGAGKGSDYERGGILQGKPFCSVHAQDLSERAESRASLTALHAPLQKGLTGQNPL